jgi:4-hydroxymandelate oxidase
VRVPGYSREVEELARTRLPEAVYRYIRQGARDGVTATEAAAAWDSFRLMPRVLRDVSEVRTRAALLGTELASPLAIAPTTLQQAVHPDGEVEMARAAVEAGTLLVVSSNAGSTFEDIAATGVPWWIQMYVTAERPASKVVLERAVAAGARAVVLTADTPLVGTKDDGSAETVWDIAQPSWLRVNFPAGYDQQPGHEKATDLGPQEIDWLRGVTGLPVVVKGVLHPHDARRCVDAGASAVWVSNHGGRQLDYALPTAHALEGVAAAIGEEAEVYVDGGVRSGRHALVAAALGADAVFVGRGPLFALAADGAAGVVRLLVELQAELDESLRLAGTPDWSAVPRDLVRP